MCGGGDRTCSSAVPPSPVRRYDRFLPVMGASGRGCSFLQRGTNTVMSRTPLSQNHLTASCRPRHENTLLSPWLQRQNQSRELASSFSVSTWVYISLLPFSGSRLLVTHSPTPNSREHFFRATAKCCCALKYFKVTLLEISPKLMINWKSRKSPQY